MFMMFFNLFVWIKLFNFLIVMEDVLLVLSFIIIFDFISLIVFFVIVFFRLFCEEGFFKVIICVVVWCEFECELICVGVKKILVLLRWF